MSFIDLVQHYTCGFTNYSNRYEYHYHRTVELCTVLVLGLGPEIILEENATLHRPQGARIIPAFHDKYECIGMGLWSVFSPPLSGGVTRIIIVKEQRL